MEQITKRFATGHHGGGMPVLLLAVLIGFIAGLRAMVTPAIVSWAAHWGWIDLQGSWLAFLGYGATPYILTLLAIGELVADQLPSTPSRKMPMQFGARLVSGALCGAALGVAGGVMIPGLIAGVIGAAIGTLGGYEGRKALAVAFGQDLPAGLIEDIVAIGCAFLIVAAII